jgi:hypothetical protein
LLEQFAEPGAGALVGLDRADVPVEHPAGGIDEPNGVLDRGDHGLAQLGARARDREVDAEHELPVVVTRDRGGARGARGRRRGDLVVVTAGARAGDQRCGDGASDEPHRSCAS